MSWEAFYEDNKGVESEVEYVEPKKKKGPLVFILGAFVILIFLMSIIPAYGIRLDPNPTYIPSLQEVVPANMEAPLEYHNNIYEAARNINPSEPQIKQISATVASRACGSNKICQSKAIYYFVRNNINYVSDPRDEYVEYPLETLKTGGADCDGQAILLATMAKSIGIPARLVLIPGHVYVEIKVDGISRKYQNSDGFVPLDPTCKNCDFGELPATNIFSEKTYLIL